MQERLEPLGRPKVADDLRAISRVRGRKEEGVAQPTPQGKTHPDKVDFGQPGWFGRAEAERS